MKLRKVMFALAAAILWAGPAAGLEPTWWGVIIATGADKARIEATPILDRPYRPLHIYGNTVRRKYYRGHAVPLPRDFVHGAGSLVFRRELR